MNIQITGYDKYGNKNMFDDLLNNKIINYEVTETQTFSCYNGTMYYVYKIILNIKASILLKWLLDFGIGQVSINIDDCKYDNVNLISITNEEIVEYNCKSVTKIKKQIEISK